MTWSKAIGLFFIVLPFVGIGIYGVRDIGWKSMLGIAGVTVAIFGSFSLGIWLFK